MDFTAALNIADEHGNTMALAEGGVVLLRLVGQRPKNIGVVGTTAKGTVFYDKHVKEENRFRKNDSWGLNWAVLEALPSYAVIRLVSEKHTYLIKAGDARIAGSFLWFKTQGFERQYFVPISSFSVT